MKAALNKKKTIIFVYNVSWFFLSHRLPIARAALQEGYDVHVAASPHGNDRTAIEMEGFTFHEIPMVRGGLNIAQDIRTVRRLITLYRDVRPDVVEHATIKPVIYGGIAAKVVRLPAVVNWMTGLGYIFISTGLVASVVRFTARSLYRFALWSKSCRVIFENPDDRDYFVSNGIVPSGRTNIIRGAGVDTTQFTITPERPGTPIVVLAGRMLKDKGVLEFVQAAEILREKGHQFRFILVGDVDDGNPASLTTHQLSTWNRSGVVEWWGRRNDMSDVIAQSHVVCLPSYREGLPKVLLEAGASGRPLVATNVPGCREIVKDGVTGILVPPKDAGALAQALEKLLLEKGLRTAMGQAAREAVMRDFSLERVVSDTLSVYRTVVP